MDPLNDRSLKSLNRNDNLKVHMTHQERSTFIAIVIMLFFIITFTNPPPVLAASQLLPNVSPRMERPNFWITKIRNPNHLLLTPEEIQKMNEEGFKRQDLYLCNVKDLNEEWTREEILSLLKEDWEGFGRTEEVRYGRNGIPLGDFFWNELRENLNQDSIKERYRILFGLIIKRTNIRVFPTDELSMSSPHDDEFDRFQHSSISPGSPIGIYHFSKDKEWAYVQTPFIRGWIHTHDLAIAKEKGEVVNYEEAKDRLVITGNTIRVFDVPSLRQPIFLSQMGDTFPLLSIPAESKKGNAFFVIEIPSKDDNGLLTIQKGYIRANEDVHRGFLPYTQEKLAWQAFKMLHQPYGWGEMFGARDCSRFIMDIFATFGILMPRNSKLQARIGTELGPAEGKTLREKKKLLDQAPPLSTLLRLPGHIMLYLGKYHGRYYVIHNIWGIQKAGEIGPVMDKIGRVVVSDLSLGSSGPNGSLLDRITDIRVIEPDSTVPNKIP
jgi:hypothetical protein